MHLGVPGGRVRGLEASRACRARPRSSPPRPTSGAEPVRPRDAALDGRRHEAQAEELVELVGRDLARPRVAEVELEPPRSILCRPIRRSSIVFQTARHVRVPSVRVTRSGRVMPFPIGVRSRTSRRAQEGLRFLPGRGRPSTSGGGGGREAGLAPSQGRHRAGREHENGRAGALHAMVPPYATTRTTRSVKAAGSHSADDLARGRNADVLGRPRRGHRHDLLERQAGEPHRVADRDVEPEGGAGEVRRARGGHAARSATSSTSCPPSV